MSNEKPFVDMKAVEETVAAVKNNPGLAKVTFAMTGTSIGGVALSSQTGALVQDGQADAARVGQFSLISDEPVPLMGTDRGVSPAEYALQSLAGCYTVTLSAMAAAKNIQLDKIALELFFDIDLQGFLGIDKSVRNGAQAIRVDVQLESSNAGPDELDALVKALPSHSPLHDTLANPVRIETRRIPA